MNINLNRNNEKLTKFVIMINVKDTVRFLVKNVFIFMPPPPSIDRGKIPLALLFCLSVCLKNKQINKPWP